MVLDSLLYTLRLNADIPLCDGGIWRYYLLLFFDYGKIVEVGAMRFSVRGFGCALFILERRC